MSAKVETPQFQRLYSIVNNHLPNDLFTQEIKDDLVLALEEWANNELLPSLQSSVKRMDITAEAKNIADPRFDGAMYDKNLDQKRLCRLHAKLFNYMMDGQWHTLGQMSKENNMPEGSASARLRDFRKQRFGGHTVLLERAKDSSGLWLYKLVPNTESLSYKQYIKEKENGFSVS